jgi:hypothetical protein
MTRKPHPSAYLATVYPRQFSQPRFLDPLSGRVDQGRGHQSAAGNRSRRRGAPGLRAKYAGTRVRRPSILLRGLTSTLRDLVSI